jgi:uncharacterized protein YukJ
MVCLKNYALLSGRIEADLGTHTHSSATHYWFVVRGGELTYCVSVNVQGSDQPDVRLVHLVPLDHNICKTLPREAEGLTFLASAPCAQRLDYLRSEGLRAALSRQKPCSASAIADVLGGALVPGRRVYVYGGYYSDVHELPVSRKPSVLHVHEQHAGLPPRGVHLTHMNQGNRAPFEYENGIYQDGGILVETADGILGLFFSFSQQVLTTDDRGDPL